MRINYGINNNLIDVSEICKEKLTKNNIISIPNGDYARAHYFTDPLYGVQKKIFIKNNDSFTEYDEYTQLKINILDNTITNITNNDINNII